jgi:hypothetical protein
MRRLHVGNPVIAAITWVSPRIDHGLFHDQCEIRCQNLTKFLLAGRRHQSRFRRRGRVPGGTTLGRKPSPGRQSARPGQGGKLPLRLFARGMKICVKYRAAWELGTTSDVAVQATARRLAGPEPRHRARPLCRAVAARERVSRPCRCGPLWWATLRASVRNTDVCSCLPVKASCRFGFAQQSRFK